jgi:hypothetical protein
MLKKLTLAALGLTMLTGSAFADSNIHGSSSGTTGAFTSGAMADDYGTTRGVADDPKSSLPESFQLEGAGADSYGYAAPSAPRHVGKTKHKHRS